MADWKDSLKIHSLARDLGLKPSNDAVQAIKAYCYKRVRSFLRDFPAVKTLHELLELSANKLETKIEEIRSDADLVEVVGRYTSAGEKSFALLDRELDPSVYGITFKRTRAKSWEPGYVSVIDSRGQKAARRYFTKWHELGHLLILTSQLRLEFRRTHVHPDQRDPEERLVDVLAGEFGFLREIVSPHLAGSISFEKLEQVRLTLCPDASQIAALIGIARIWPEPCIQVRAESGLRKHEQRNRVQSSFDFVERPAAVLRAAKANSNEAARESGFMIFPNMRIPDTSVIADIYRFGAGHSVRTESLDTWITSDGSHLGSGRIRVEARWAVNGVDALISLIE
jgi:hypothetical protein